LSSLSAETVAISRYGLAMLARSRASEGRLRAAFSHSFL
jgi:hypothetical protein